VLGRAGVGPDAATPFRFDPAAPGSLAVVTDPLAPGPSPSGRRLEFSADRAFSPSAGQVPCGFHAPFFFFGFLNFFFSLLRLLCLFLFFCDRQRSSLCLFWAALVSRA